MMDALLEPTQQNIKKEKKEIKFFHMSKLEHKISMPIRLTYQLELLLNFT